MKKLFLLAMFAAFAMPQSAQADVVIAAIDNWDSTTAPTVGIVATGFTATATASTSSGAWSISDSGTDPGRGSSVDTTWGTFDGNGTAASSVTDLGTANFTVTNGRPSAEVTLVINNTGSDDYDLNNFHFDAVAFRPNAPRTYTLEVLSGDITNGIVFASDAPQNDNSTNAITHLGGSLGTTHDVHDDLDISLAGLADNTLAAGESATIQIAFSNGTGSGGGHHLFLDNVGVSGAIAVAIPEPSSLALLGLSGMAMVIRRRK